MSDEKEKEKPKEKKINFYNGAVIGIEDKGDYKEIKIYDGMGTFFCRKDLGIKVGQGYKFGIVDTDTPKRYEIVSVEQQILKQPAFKSKEPAVPGAPNPPKQMVKMALEDYRELVSGKNIKIRAECLSAAIKILEKTAVIESPENFMRRAINLAKDIEPYFV